MVVHTSLRQTSLLASFYRRILAWCRDRGLFFLVHYCRPDMVRQYELLGHRRYHMPFNLPSGQLLVPMILSLNPKKVPDGWALPPGYARPAFCLLLPEERMTHVAARLAGAAAWSDAQRMPEGMDKIIASSVPLALHKGQVLSVAGEVPYCGLVLSGTLDERTPAGSTSVGPGGWFGPWQMRTSTPMASSLVARTPAEVLIIPAGLLRKAPLESVQENDPSALRAVAATADADDN
jgi:hypothetical protein